MSEKTPNFAIFPLNKIHFKQTSISKFVNFLFQNFGLCVNNDIFLKKTFI